jgi:hypothetical protein
MPFMRATAAALAALVLAGCGPAAEDGGAAISIERQGAFAIGGKVLGDAAASSLHCDHGVVEYQIPAEPRAVSLLMWHSASAVAWQYLWDGPRVGRGNWSCVGTTFSPEIGRDQGNFAAWRFGSTYPSWFDGVQFPKDDPEAWNQAMRARYQEFDTIENAQLESDAAAKLADKIGPTVALTNSAGGLRALLTALKSDNIVGLVAYENVGYVYPEGEGPGTPPGPFGPIEVPLEEFRKLTRIPMQMVWGDNTDKSDRYRPTVEESRRFVDLVNEHGGKAELLLLPEAGLTGNTHIPFADLNNIAVADLLSAFLHEHGLDARAR